MPLREPQLSKPSVNTFTSDTTTVQSPKAQTESQYPLIIILIFLLLGTAYSLVVPPFETPDESFHYAFARHISQGHWLPVQTFETEQPWSHEGSQAPLYYLLTGMLTAGIDQNDYSEIGVRNPRANMGDPLEPGNKNFMLYSGIVFPLEGSNLALHVGRWFSLLLGAITLWYLWRTAQLALPGKQGIAKVALIFAALIPQFVFVSASFSNDNMVTVLGSVTVYYLACIVNQLMQKEEPPLWQWIGLGLLLGLAALSKLSGLGLCLLVAVAIWGVAIYQRDWLLPWRILFPLLVPLVLVAGWWYWRNYTLYGDWLGANMLLGINGLRTEEASWLERWNEFRGLRYSFWGLFGWFNILLPRWCYHLFDGITLLGLLGLVGTVSKGFSYSKAQKARYQQKLAQFNIPVLLLLAVWALIPFGLIVYWAQQATSSQGRLLFPSLSALVILLVAGLYFWLDLISQRELLRRATQAIGAFIPIFLLACTLFALLVLIPQTYYPAQAVPQFPAEGTRVDLTYGELERNQTQFSLLGLEIHQRGIAQQETAQEETTQTRYAPGERVPISLYLQALDKPNADYQIFIQLLDERQREIANLTTHPGWGRNPTSFWKVGDIYADTYLVPIDSAPFANDLNKGGNSDAQLPLLAQIYVGFVDPATEQSGRLPLVAYDETGSEVTPFLGSIVIAPKDARPLAHVEGLQHLDRASNFGGLIAITGYAATKEILSQADNLSVTVNWQAIGHPTQNYIAFVHLLNEEGERLAGYDQPPAGARLPTRYWQAGDLIQSQFDLQLPQNLPTGSYQLWLGLYEEGSQGAIRLPVTEAGSLESAHNQLLLQGIEVISP